jgi:hypothetical protein
MAMRFFALKMFPPKINSLQHPEVKQFKYLLESIGKIYDSNLATFKIENGVVTFNYDKEDFDCNIYENISDVIGVHPKLFDTQRGMGEYLRWVTWSNESKNRIVSTKNPIHLQSLN